jgi:predicted nuclease with TOPRIM domain
MIKIDALYFLLLIELLLVLAVIAVVLLFRGKKVRALYQSIVQEFEQARKTQEELRKQLTETGAAAQQPSGPIDTAAASAEEAVIAQEKFKIELSALEGQLKEKTTKLNDLQAKFDDLEKEYLILYRQQQKQEAENSKS